MANAAGFSNRLLCWNLFASLFLAIVLFSFASFYSDLSIVALVLVVGRFVLYLFSFYVLPRQIVEGAWRSMSKVLIFSIMPACLLVALLQVLDLTLGGKFISGVIFLMLLLLLNLKLVKVMFKYSILK